jgi:sporulation protein YlmC with PRC-barrel domain
MRAYRYFYMNAQRLDTLSEQHARKFLKCRVIDDRGEIIGTVHGLWIDFSTKQIAYIGVRTNSLSHTVHAVPAGSASLQENGKLIQLEYSKHFVRGSPSFYPNADFAEVEKETVYAYFGRIVALHRVSSIEEMRPEEPIHLG